MNKTELKELAQKVLEDGYLMSLGTVDGEGVWVADVIYVHGDDFNLYWISMPQARHSQAAVGNNKVACAVTATQDAGKERALQIEGIAEKVDGPLFEYEQKLEAKRGLPAPARAGEILEKGHVWYVLKPTRVELIHTELFGYERQSVL